MRHFILGMALVIAWGCTPAHHETEAEFLQMWTARSSSVQELAAAANRRFTNNTPVSYVVSILGKNHSILEPYSVIDPKTGRPPIGVTCSLMYELGEDLLFINTTAPVGSDPLLAKFTGARFTMHVKGTQKVISGGGRPTDSPR
jgi:hypothetical protein